MTTQLRCLVTITVCSLALASHARPTRPKRRRLMQHS